MQAVGEKLQVRIGVARKDEAEVAAQADAGDDDQSAEAQENIRYDESDDLPPVSWRASHVFSPSVMIERLPPVSKTSIDSMVSVDPLIKMTSDGRAQLWCARRQT